MKVQPKSADRLDAAESVLFAEQLKHVNATILQTLTPELKARTLVPTLPGVDPGATVYEYRMMTKYGQAKIATGHSDDAPRVDLAGEKAASLIKEVTASYGYHVDEIRACQKAGIDLPTLKAQTAKEAIDRKIDSILAVGDSTYSLKGLLNQTSTTTATLGTKVGTGTKAWEGATADEILKDVRLMVTALITALQGAGGPVFRRYMLIVPEEQYAYISLTRMGDGSDMTILKWLLANVPQLEGIEGWYHCNNAGSGGTVDRAVMYPRSLEVVQGIVNLEFTPLAPQPRNFEEVVPCRAKCGGVIVPYPVAMCYADEL